MPKSLILLVLTCAISSQAEARLFEGPGRFCGYSPIIDLEHGEAIEPLRGGIHGGTFRWTGKFGSLDVYGIGWASRPNGKIAAKQTTTGNSIFRERLDEGRHIIAIWNRAHGAAYFSSDVPLTQAQKSAIQRVYLFNEGEEPEGCRYRMIFSWEF